MEATNIIISWNTENKVRIEGKVTIELSEAYKVFEPINNTLVSNLSSIFAQNTDIVEGNLIIRAHDNILTDNFISDNSMAVTINLDNRQDLGNLQGIKYNVLFSNDNNTSTGIRYDIRFLFEQI